MKKCTLLAAMAVACLAASAQYMEQSFVLKPGWNAFFLKVAPIVSPTELFSPLPVESVSLYSPESFDVTRQDEGSILVDDPVPVSSYFKWSRTPSASTMNKLVGDAVYICFNTGSVDRAFTVRGKPRAPRIAWHEAIDSAKMLNIVGLSLVIQAADAFDAIITEGEGLMAGRARMRREMASTATRMRYNDMFFRQMRNKSLTRYSQSLDIAKKYAFLAAQAYDYETSQLPYDDETASVFRNEIVSARTIGELDEHGRPMVNGGYGDPGLSDILARMKHDWDMLKPRLGINNPQKDATWFSLRKECFRINGDSSGDLAWKTELSKYWVPDLNASPEFRRYCMPFAATGNGSSPEPGLVIPFSTTIDFAKNFFGHDLAGGDSAYDSTYFATKVACASIRFEGYNKRLNG